MSVHNDYNKKLEDGNGIKTEFEFRFKIFKNVDLKVYKVVKSTGEKGNALVLNTDYTVTINKVGEGGKVIYTVPPTEEQQSGIYRDITITQAVDIPTDTEYIEKTMTNALDRACMVSQQLKEEIDRCIQLPTFSDITDVEFETPVDGKATYWDVTDTKATLKNCNTNPDDLVAECDTIRDDCDSLKNDCIDLKSDCNDIKKEVGDITEAAVGVLPLSENITHWARDDEGNIVNFPLESFKVGRTPFIEAVSDDHKKLKIFAPLYALLELENGVKKYYTLLSNLIIDIDTSLDTDIISAGKDYYLYLCFDSVNGWAWKISLNSTYPDGFDEYTSRKLGGFHTLCVEVTADNAPRAGHPAIGYNAGDIIPNSVWAYNFKSYSGNEGKAFVAPHREWQYIYNISGNGKNTRSVFGATRSHTRNYHKFVEDLFSVNDMMITQDGFSCGMDGSNYLTAVKGAVQPNPDTTGGHLDTANKRMISNYFLEEGCGLQWVFAEGLHATGSGNWNAPDTDGKGQQYGVGYVVLVGGAWSNGGYTGPRCRAFYYSAASALAYLGGRGRSCHIEF